METIQGANNLILTCRRGSGGITILRAETADSSVTLPETLWGEPVTALGDHAFTPETHSVEGERVCITCGPAPNGEPDNQNLASLTLPKTLRVVGDYAFYHCTGLRTLCLWDTVDSWGGGVFMNCRLLDTFRIRMTGEEARALCYAADELSRELDATLIYPDGETARFLFPEYRESYEENSPAHHFDYNLSGAGYPYHHCFRDRRFSPMEFDDLWDAFLQTEHDDDCAMRLAFWRLRLSKGLTLEARERYLRYLRAHAGEGLAWLLRERDAGDLAWFLTTANPERRELSVACELARRLRAAEAQALLLETLHRRFPAGAEKRFEL